MRIKNWKTFQHFKDRRPPWIKLHRDILDQRDISLISDCAFRVLVFLWLLAAEDKDMNGELPDVDTICFRLRMDKVKITESIQELGEWIDYSDIVLISDCHQVVPPETETEAYKEETETQPPTGDDDQFYKMKELSALAVKYLGWNGNLHPGQADQLRPLTSVFKAEVDFGFNAAASANAKSIAYVIKAAGNNSSSSQVDTTEFERLLEASR